MDLISIRRTYNNRRNLIFIVCILLICVTLIITTIEVVNNRRAKKLYLSYLEQVQNAENEAKEIAVAKELAEKLNATKLTIKHKVGANGQLIGSVTNKEVSETLEDQFSIMIDKKNISLDKKIKSVGIYELDCKLGHSIHATLKVDIIGE